jgi:hypothetical protein
MAAGFQVGSVAMASEDEFPPLSAEVRHMGDTNVQTPEPVKLEDLVSKDENPFVPLESRPSSKAGIEASMKSLSMKVSRA